MAIGRASGEQRVERAILDALDSPLVYGSDINRAKRILFNIYASEKAPIRVLEMQEISEFFDQLDPDIDVIWGTSTDNSLDDDAKVIILAADMGDDLKPVEAENEDSDDERYERLIAKLYPPLMAKPQEETDPPFVVEAAPIPEPAEEQTEEIVGATAAEQSEEPDVEQTYESEHTEKDDSQKAEPRPTTTLGRWRSWLNRKLGDMMNDEDDQ